MAVMLARLRCWIGQHDWRVVYGPVCQTPHWECCARCGGRVWLHGVSCPACAELAAR